MEYLQLFLTVAVIVPVRKTASNSLHYSGHMSYHQTSLLYCHYIWVMWIFILLGTIHELLEYRNFSIHSVHKCSSWPRMCMFHEVFQLPYLSYHLLLPYSCQYFVLYGSCHYEWGGFSNKVSHQRRHTWHC